MKLDFLFVTLFMTVHAYGNNMDRFDGVYSLINAEGSFKYNKVVDCESPIEIGKDTLDTRGSDCQFEMRKGNPEDKCSKLLYIKAFPGVVKVSEYSMPQSIFDPASPIVDDNRKYDSCDDVNFYVCWALKSTNLHESSEYVSKKLLVSNFKKTGFDLNFISLQNTNHGITYHRRVTQYYASGKRSPDLMEEYNVKCHYEKQN